MARSVRLLFDEIIKETDSAFLVRFGTDEQWIPKSLVDDLEEPIDKINYGYITIPKWFAMKNGLEDYEVDDD